MVRPLRVKLPPGEPGHLLTTRCAFNISFLYLMRLPLLVTHVKHNHITKPLVLLSYLVPFVQKLLPELDRLYASERQPIAAAGGSRRLCPAGGSAPLEAGGFAPPGPMASADDTTPAHATERPAWVDALLRFFKPLLRPHTSNLQVKGKIEALVAKSKDGSSDFTMQLPLSFLAVPVTAIPTVYPLRAR